LEAKVEQALGIVFLMSRFFGAGERAKGPGQSVRSVQNVCLIVVLRIGGQFAQSHHAGVVVMDARGGILGSLVQRFRRRAVTNVKLPGVRCARPDSDRIGGHVSEHGTVGQTNGITLCPGGIAHHQGKDPSGQQADRPSFRLFAEHE